MVGSRDARGLLVALIGGIFVLGCEVSPQPIPPADPPKDAGPVPIHPPDARPIVTIDPTRLALRFDGAIARVVGRAGAITPSGAEVDVVNLARDVAPATASVAVDGSFDVAAAGAVEGEIFRLTALKDESRSEPVDLVIGATGDELKLLPAERVLDDCFVTAPAEVDFGEVALGSNPVVEVRLTNRCAFSVTLGQAVVRPASPAFDISAPSTVTLGAEESAVARVTFSPANAGATRAVLVVRIAGPTAGLRAVSLFGRAR